MGTEIEFKWEANAPRSFWRMKRALQYLQARSGAVRDWTISDVYLDTPTQDFEKQQIAFRVRRINIRWEATFKTRTEIVNGKAVRREETCALPGVQTLPQALQFLRQKKQWKGLNLTQLQPLFTLKNKRQTQEIFGPGWQAELAFDTCEILLGGRRVCFKEIELELKKGRAAGFEKFAMQLTALSQLNRARISKVKTAFLLHRMWGE